MTILADLARVHARSLVTCAGPAPRRGAAQAEVTAIPDGAIAVHDGIITFAGPSAELAPHLSPVTSAQVVVLSPLGSGAGPDRRTSSKARSTSDCCSSPPRARLRRPSA